MRILLAPLSFLYLLLYLLRWTFYEFGIFRKVKLHQPVLCVGNITMGGSGKTPFLLYLLEKMQERGVKSAVATRSYGASARKPGVLPDPSSPEFRAEVFGDEACLIKKSFPKVPVVSGRSKSAAARKASEQENHVILVDDGFQHWRLHRDLDVVLMDVTERDRDWEVLPLGRAREPFSALGRSQVIVLTKTNLVSEERLQAVYNKIQNRVAPELPLLCEARHELVGVRPLGKGQILPLESLGGRPLALLSGVAKPEGFEGLVRQSGLGPVVYHLKLKDHGAPGVLELRDLKSACQNLNCKSVLMTQKDAVKWSGEDLGLELFEAVLSLRVSKNEDALWKKINQLYS